MKNKTKIPEGWELKKIGAVLTYERPDKYIVKSTSYSNNYDTPVLTANKSFVLGHTDEDFGIYDNIPTIIFDDFTTDCKYVDFPFKIKSSAIKILRCSDSSTNLKFIYEIMKSIKFPVGNHKRYYISQYQDLDIVVPPLATQNKIAEILGAVDEEIEKVENIIGESENIKIGLMRQFFNLCDKDRKESKLGEICNFITGKLNSNKADPSGKYPFFTCSQETFRISSYSFDCEAILLAGNNAAGIYSVKYYDGKFDAYQRTYVITVKDKTRLDYLYLKNFLEWKLDDLRKKSVGTSTKFLTVKLLLNLKMSLPRLEEQKYHSQILSSLDNKILIYKTIKNNLIQLKKGLMTDLLSGNKILS